MARLFISHSSRNNDKAIELRDWLAANGWDDVFLDLDPERGIVAGQRWKEALQQAAYRCEVVLALVSAEWLASGWCKSEIDAARLIGKKIIIALTGIDKSQVPLDLIDEQFIDLSGDPQAYRRLQEGLKHAGLDPLSFPFEPGRRPYPGFAYFEEQDAAIFFGREAQIVHGLDEFRRLVRTGVTRMLVILGASGSGKSSFLRAGLWPRLKRDDRAWLPLPIIRPERTVISGTYGLAGALQQIISEARFAPGIRERGLPRSRADIEDFIKTEDGLVTLFNALRDIGQVPGLSGENTAPPTIVLGLDQGEELFNEEGRDEAERFVEILTRTLRADPRTLAILAMRSDSFPLVQAHPSLAALPKDTFTLDMMLEGSYRAVIEDPAGLIQPTPLRIDPQLTDALLKEISGQDALPLLAFTLAHLYENYRADNELTLSGYDKLGHVKGVIDTAVKQAFAAGVAKGELPKDAKAQLALARAAFIPHLAQVNATGQFVRRVATLDQIPVEPRPLIDSFAEQRLLIKDRRKDADGKDVDVVEVAHEALLRQPPFSEWLEEDRDFLIWRERLSQARAAFEADERGLLAGRELEIARSWVQTRAQHEIEPVDQSFIHDSSAADDRRRAEEAEAEQRRAAAEREEQERRIRYAEQAALAQKKIAQRTAIGSGVAMLAMLLLMVAGGQWWLTKKETLSALIQSSEGHFAANEDWDALTASLHAVQELRTIPLSPLVDYFNPKLRPQISQSLQQALYGIKEYKRLKYEIKGYVDRQSSIGQLKWSPDGKNLAFLSGNDEVTVWRPDSNALRTIRPQLNAESSDRVRSVGWRPVHDDELTISSQNGIIEFLDNKGNQISPSIKLINKINGNINGDLYGISWRPDGQELAFATFAHGLVVSKPDGARLQVLKPDGTWTNDFNNQVWSQVWSVSWSHEPQHLLAAAGADGTVRWGNPDDGSLACKASPGPYPFSMSWSPDGKSLAVGLIDNTVRLLAEDCKSGQTEHELRAHTAPVTGVSWSSDWRLATASEGDGTVRLWDKEGTPLDTFHIPTVRGGVQWRPDGQVFATLGQYDDQYGLVRLWKDNPLVKTFTVPGHVAIWNAALSPDGLILASASINGSLNLWRQDRDNRWPSEPELLPNSVALRLSWSPDGQLLAFTSDHALTIWDRSGKIIWHSDGTNQSPYKPLGNGIFTVMWSPDGKVLATGDGRSDVTIWDAETGSILSQTSSCGEWVQTLAWNPVDNRSLAVGCFNKGSAHLLQWNPDKKDLEETKLVDHEENLVDDSAGVSWSNDGAPGVSWSNDGNILATSGNNRINLWRRDGTLMRSVDTGEKVGKVAWSPDGTMLAVASGFDVQLWARDGLLARDGHPITVLKGHSRIVQSVMWNKQTLVSASDDGTVRLWQIDKGLANDPLHTLLVHSCNWLRGYLEENPLISKEDSDLQGLCRQFYTAAVAPALPADKKAPPAPVQPPAAHEQTKQSSAR
jgi:WD40 repeat protein